MQRTVVRHITSLAVGPRGCVSEQAALWVGLGPPSVGLGRTAPHPDTLHPSQTQCQSRAEMSAQVPKEHLGEVPCLHPSYSRQQSNETCEKIMLFIFLRLNSRQRFHFPGLDITVVVLRLSPGLDIYLTR